MKTCSKCKKEKDDSEFYKGKLSQCKICHLSYNKTPKRRKEFREYMREYMKTHPQKYNPKENPMIIYYSITQHHFSKGFVECITSEDFIKWYKEQPKVCFYCGIDEEKQQKITHRRLEIERLDNNVSYVLGNIALACSFCNKIKSDILSSDEMKIIGEMVMKEKWKHLFK